MEGCIYLWTNKHNLKKYVGQHNRPDPIERTREHLKKARGGCNYLLHKAVRKWGVEAFTIEVLCICTHSALGNLEAYFAEQHESYVWEHGYNMVICGNTPPPQKGIPRSHETKEKLRQANLGRKHSPKTIEKLRQANLGRRASPEAKENMSRVKRGVKIGPATDAAIENMKKAALNRAPRSTESIEKSRQGLIAYHARRKALEVKCG